MALRNDLIPTTVGELGGVTQELVDARELHAALGVGRSYAHWIRERIDELSLEEGKDYFQGRRAQARPFMLSGLAALLIVMRQRSIRGVLSNATKDVGQQVLYLREQLLEMRPELVKVRELLRVQGLSDEQRAKLMDCSLDEWMAHVEVVRRGFGEGAGADAGSAS